jgi:hypothetical protein
LVGNASSVKESANRTASLERFLKEILTDNRTQPAMEIKDKRTKKAWAML